MGAQGWELVSMTPFTYLGTSHEVLFRIQETDGR